MKKMIYIPSYKKSKVRIQIGYSQIENLKNQAIFKNNRNFFAKETVNTLFKSLRNTKKAKSSKVEAD